MSEETTQNMPDSRSFEERIFARFDTIDARLSEIDVRLNQMDTRLPVLEQRLTIRNRSGNEHFLKF
jgi:hypothetical protein